VKELTYPEPKEDPNYFAKKAKEIEKLKKKTTNEDSGIDDGWYAHKEIHGSKAISAKDWKDMERVQSRSLSAGWLPVAGWLEILLATYFRRPYL
jgi:hypothetical protein